MDNQLNELEQSMLEYMNKSKDFYYYVMRCAATYKLTVGEVLQHQTTKEYYNSLIPGGINNH